MALPDLTDLTNDELTELIDVILNLQEKRVRLAEGPARIAAEAQRFIDDGGDPAAIVLPTEPTPPAPVEVPGELVETDVEPVEGEQLGALEYDDDAEVLPAP